MIYLFNLLFFLVYTKYILSLVYKELKKTIIMEVGDLIISVIFSLIALALFFYVVPMAIVGNDDYHKKMKLKNVIRFFDFYFILMPVMIVVLSLGIPLVFIIPSLIIAPVNLFFDITSLEEKELHIANLIAIYYFLVIMYSALRNKYIYPECSVL